ncbi:hypothetical protein ACM16X_02755 [Haloarcula japonica]|uniref:hypothetical protein n=1 Tax=Haloarcula japonica TaxID=29282 RepID=UPI0039F689EA
MRTKELGEVLANIGMFFVLTNALPLFLLYGLGAASDADNMVKYFLYATMPVSVVLYIFYRVYLKNRGVFERNPELKGFDFITLHSPEQTWLGRQSKWIRSPLRLFFICTIVSLLFGALVGVTGQFAPGDPGFVQGSVQGDEAKALGLAVEPAVSAETYFFNVGLLMGQTALSIYLLVSAGVRLSTATVVSKMIAVPLTTLEFLVYHNLRYGAQETSQIGIGMLGLMTNSSMAATHSIIPGYMIHFSGNLFDKASQLGVFTDEMMIVYVMLGVLTSLIALGVFYFWDSRRGR